MNIKVLCENTAKDEKFAAEHGISFLISMSGKKILFDMGSTDVFLKNAAVFREDLSIVDVAVISHGHYDHGGGLENFLKVNHHAPVYLTKCAFENHYSVKDGIATEIGLKKELKYNPQIRIIDKDTVICDGIRTMGKVEKKHPMPITNQNLMKDGVNGYVPDDFTHEHNLVIEQNGEYILLAGCAHCGIQNILEHFKTLYGTMPKAVLGGFHLSSRTKQTESKEFVRDLSEYLLSTGAQFYTCHCTGPICYSYLKEYMGERIEYISAGSNLIL